MKINNPISKWAKYMNRHFAKEDVWMVYKYMNRCSIAYVIREMQIKPIMRYYCITSRMFKIPKLTIPDAGENAEQ